MKLDFTSFENAIAQIDEALMFCASDTAKADPRLALHLRAGAIQAFEFTYDLAIKMLKRYFEANDANPSVIDEMTFHELIRRGYEAGLLGVDLAQWKAFRQHRGTTSHTYDETKAQVIFEAIPNFLVEAKHLLGQLQARQASDGGYES